MGVGWAVELAELLVRLAEVLRTAIPISSAFTLLTS